MDVDVSPAQVRPFNPYRDLESVVKLMEAAFGDRLGPSGRATLARMRRYACVSPLLRWLLPFVKVGAAPGFVWVEDGCVVGNVSLRRSEERGGYFIGNVVVHPDWRGQGIAGELMNTALRRISASGGRWVGLEVRADNEIAQRLYARAGFQEIDRSLHMLRPADLPWDEDTPSHPSLRRGCSEDGAALVELMHRVVPEAQRSLLELRESDYRPSWKRTLALWLKGRREQWWVIDANGALCGAVRVLRKQGRYPNQLEVLVAPECAGEVESYLVRRGVADLASSEKGIEIMLPDVTEPLRRALEEAGFEKLRVLMQMRLDLVRHVCPVDL